MSSVRNRLAQLRGARDWHRSVVAAEFNLGDRTIQRWENGETPIPSELIPRLAELFEVTPEYLMGWDRNPVATGTAA